MYFVWFYSHLIYLYLSVHLIYSQFIYKGVLPVQNQGS